MPIYGITGRCRHTDGGFLRVARISGLLDPFLKAFPDQSESFGVLGFVLDVCDLARVD